MVQPLPAPPRSSPPTLCIRAATFSESIAVKSSPSTSPARRIAARFRTCVTRCDSVRSASARAWDQPTNGTLTNSGFACSANNNTLGRLMPPPRADAAT